MTARRAEPIRSRGPAVEHWATDDQFARQLGCNASAAAIARRWDIFADAVNRVSERTAGEAVPTLRVLDAGCGDGINLVALRRILSGLRRAWQLAAVDMNPLRVERARIPDRANGAIALGSVVALPFGSGLFDVVLCNHVLEHVPRPADALREIARVLRPGGLAVVSVPNEGCALAWLRNHVLQRSILAATDHVNFFTAPSLTRLLEGAGLRVDAVHTEGFFVPHLRAYNGVRGSVAGRRLIEQARRRFPSQAAGLIALATHAERAVAREARHDTGTP